MVFGSRCDPLHLELGGDEDNKEAEEEEEDVEKEKDEGVAPLLKI